MQCSAVQRSTAQYSGFRSGLAAQSAAVGCVSWPASALRTRAAAGCISGLGLQPHRHVTELAAQLCSPLSCLPTTGFVVDDLASLVETVVEGKRDDVIGLIYQIYTFLTARKVSHHS